MHENPFSLRCGTTTDCQLPALIAAQQQALAEENKSNFYNDADGAARFRNQAKSLAVSIKYLKNMMAVNCPTCPWK